MTATEKTSVPGIRKKIGVKGVTYEVRIRIAGHPPIGDTFPTFEAAKRWKRDREGAISKGGTVSNKPERILVGDIVAWFKETVPAAPKPKKGEKPQKPVGPVRTPSETARLDQIAHDVGEFSVKALTHQIIDKYMARLLETPVPKKEVKEGNKRHPLYNGGDERLYSQSSVRKIYYTLKKIVESHAIAHGYPLDVAQFRDQNIPEAWAGHRDRRLEDNEEERLRESIRRGLTLHGEWDRLLTVFLETGMRAQEALRSTWDNLSLDGRTLFLPADIVKKVGRGKKVRKGKARHVPLSSRAVEALRTHEKTKKDDEDRIFWQWRTTATLDHAFKRIATRAGCPDVTPHTLRHEATARLFEKNKLTDLQIAKITGHTNMTTLAGYYKYRPQSIATLLD